MTRPPICTVRQSFSNSFDFAYIVHAWLERFFFGKTVNREVKLHVYGKRQTSDSSWEFLKIENKQIKTAQNNSYGRKNAKLLIYV